MWVKTKDLKVVKLTVSMVPVQKWQKLPLRLYFPLLPFLDQFQQDSIKPQIKKLKENQLN